MQRRSLCSGYVYGRLHCEFRFGMPPVRCSERGVPVDCRMRVRVRGWLLCGRCHVLSVLCTDVLARDVLEKLLPCFGRGVLWLHQRACGWVCLDIRVRFQVLGGILQRSAVQLHSLQYSELWCRDDSRGVHGKLRREVHPVHFGHGSGALCVDGQRMQLQVR